LSLSRSQSNLTFGLAANVLYGASDTGKSFVLDSIDFMLGGKGPLRDIPEREGYDRILLGMQLTTGEAFTLHRSAAGGGFLLFKGLHESKPPEGGTELREQHDERRDDNLSRFLQNAFAATS